MNFPTFFSPEADRLAGWTISRTHNCPDCKKLIIGEDDSELCYTCWVNNYHKIQGEAYCYVCTARVEYCRCPPGEGANRL